MNITHLITCCLVFNVKTMIIEFISLGSSHNKAYDAKILLVLSVINIVFRFVRQHIKYHYKQ